ARQRLARAGRPGPPAMSAPGDAVTRRLVTFGRILREVGLEVGPGRLQDAITGLGEVDLTRRDEVYYALRCTLVSRHDDLALFDAAFAAFWERAPAGPVTSRVPAGIPPPAPPAPPPPGSQAASDEAPGEESVVLAVSSQEEVLRNADFADM